MPGYTVSSYIELFHKRTSFKSEIKTLSSFILLVIFLFNMKCQNIDINFKKFRIYAFFIVLLSNIVNLEKIITAKNTN